MNTRATIAAALALSLSLAAHGAVLARISPSQGGTATQPGGAAFSMRGESFEDLSAGSLMPVTPTTDAIVPATPATTEAAVAAPPVINATPDATSTTNVPASAATPVTVSASTTIAATPTAPASAAESIAGSAAPIAQRPDSDTPRPQTRPPRPEPPVSTATAPAPEPTPTPPRQGTADRSATAGTQQGRDDGETAQRQGNADAAPGPTAREVARYPQLVNRHLSRLRRPNSRFSGTAVIGFTVAPGGGLASIGVVQSSGDAGFDDLALNHIRGAVPFPAPPEGAQTRFSVSVRGR